MRLIQYETAQGETRLGVVADDGSSVRQVPGMNSSYELALTAIAAGRTLAEQVQAQGQGEPVDYPALLAAGRVLPPLTHPDPAHCLITGTGLTHLGSADARDKMHQKIAGAEAALTDSMKMFRWGLEGGKPGAGQIGSQPEWFYKGDGHSLIRPGGDLPLPAFAGDGGEEPELAGLYVIGPDGTPYRLGYALGNEFSDHITERQNYLWLAHSKLRACALGPELRVGPLPADLRGECAIVRESRDLWRKPFLTGEANMSHSFENLEHHHFKYRQFLQPGQVHIHFFGTATLSFADQIATQEGDVFEISLPEFGQPLRNRLVRLPESGLVRVEVL